MKGMTPVEVTAMIKNVTETVAVVVSLFRGLLQRPPQKAPRRKNRRR